jgi:hypothetical protein|tara:strand:- start:1498 stop:1641 length:144 start_codon:yes stop_codon:yes gene_type:complete
MKKLLYLVVLMILVSSCRAQCGARKTRKSNKYYGTIINTNINKTVIS